VIDKIIPAVEPQRKEPSQGIGIIQRLTNTFGFIEHEFGRFYLQPVTEALEVTGRRSFQHRQFRCRAQQPNPQP
jgi:hypothetical protein